MVFMFTFAMGPPLVIASIPNAHSSRVVFGQDLFLGFSRRPRLHTHFVLLKSASSVLVLITHLRQLLDLFVLIKFNSFFRIILLCACCTCFRSPISFGRHEILSEPHVLLKFLQVEVWLDI